MSSFLSKWVVSRQPDIGPADRTSDGLLRDDAIERWVTAARDEYLHCCALLRETCATSGFVLTFRDSPLPSGEHFGRVDQVIVSAGVTEVYPTSFTIAFRLRAFGTDDNDVAVSLACSVTLVDPATGEACEIGDAIRDEMIALEHAAKHFN